MKSAKARFPVTLEVSEGRIRFINSQCPDHICESYGWLSKSTTRRSVCPRALWYRGKRRLTTFLRAAGETVQFL